jgi:hypothetical protein
MEMQEANMRFRIKITLKNVAIIGGSNHDRDRENLP